MIVVIGADCIGSGKANYHTINIAGVILEVFYYINLNHWPSIWYMCGCSLLFHPGKGTQFRFRPNEKQNALKQLY